MSADNRVSVELTTRQQDLLLEGLRYITSSIKLRREEATSDSLQLRREQLSEIRQLVAVIEGNSPAQMAIH